MLPEDAEGAAALQPLAFPPPFREDHHWDAEDLVGHIELFPEGQYVAEADGRIVGSCSNTIISEERWQAHESWFRTVGGPWLANFDPMGSTMYGLDIAVHPDFRRRGIGRAFYSTRFEFVKARGLARYGTGCRLPGFAKHLAKHPGAGQEEYAKEVVAGRMIDRTLTPLLRYGLSLLGVIHNYMEDEESLNAAALLERAR